MLSKFILNFYKPKIIIDNIGITYFENVKLNLSLHQFPLIWDHSPKLSKKRDFQKRQMLKNNILATNLIYVNIFHTKDCIKKYINVLDKVFSDISKKDINKILKSKECFTPIKRIN